MSCNHGYVDYHGCGTCCEMRVPLLEQQLKRMSQGERAADKRIEELESQLATEQVCNRCNQYHGKEPCDDITELEAKLDEISDMHVKKCLAYRKLEAKLKTANQTIEFHVAAMRDFKLMREKLDKIAKLKVHSRSYSDHNGTEYSLKYFDIHEVLAITGEQS